MRYLCSTLLVALMILLSPIKLQAQGIDVSKFQGKINWTKVAKNKSVKFAYIRATEGTSIKDPYYKANVDSARKAGLYIGSYHVYSSKTTASQQFSNFKSMVSKKKQDLIPVLDIEGHHAGHLDMARVDKLLSLMQKEYGIRPMIYTSEKVFKDHFQGKKYSSYHIFIANYHGSPTVRYTLWQYSNTGRVSGIRGNVDLDKFHPKHSLSDLYMPRLQKKKATPTDTAKKDSISTKIDSSSKT